MNRHVFGPVASRRLGRSLGIDPVRHKSCQLDCIYCECGPTPLTTLARQRFFPPEELLEELERENGVQYVAPRREAEQVSLSAIGEGEALDALRRCQPDTLTPIEAMSLLYELKQKLH